METTHQPVAARPRRRRFAASSGMLAATALVAATLTGSTAMAQDTVCDVADNRPTVRFLDTDTGVENRMAGGGCTINDLIDDERTWENHGKFVRHVNGVANSLRKEGVIDARERSTLTRAAAQGEIGKKAGYEVLFDGTAESFEDWEYAGQGGFDLLEDGTIQSRAGAGGGFGTLWYAEEEFGDFSLRLQFRDDAPGGEDVRGNSGVQVRFPALDGPVEGCPTTFNGNETGNLSWIAVNCGHEIQINDSPEEPGNDPIKTGSIYGFKNLTLDEAMPTEKGVWNDLEIRVVGQTYTVIRNGVVINEYENVPGVDFEGRPNDPDSSSRGLTGYIGLQAHGADQDVVSFRNVRIRELCDS